MQTRCFLSMCACVLLEDLTLMSHNVFYHEYECLLVCFPQTMALSASSPGALGTAALKS